MESYTRLSLEAQIANGEYFSIPIAGEKRISMKSPPEYRYMEAVVRPSLRSGGHLWSEPRPLIPRVPMGEFVALYKSGCISSFIIALFALWPIVTGLISLNVGVIAMSISLLDAFLFWRKWRK